MKLHALTLRTVRLPLIRPYVLSYRTFTEFEPIIVEVRDSDGRTGWGEGHISPGSSRETREGGWTFCRDHAAAIAREQCKLKESGPGIAACVDHGGWRRNPSAARAPPACRRR